MQTHVFVILCALCFCACKPQAPAETGSSEVEYIDTLPADFIEFYQRFHRDSVYQLAHIIFPLEGRVSDDSGQDSLAVWSARDWKLHRAIAPDAFWAIDFAIPAEGVVTEYIYARDGSFWMERRFARSSSEWFLIYYTGLQQNADVKKEE